jgi:DNA gyrase/topoisomerase IV subunit A
MSYTWTQESAPMTSLLALERALYSLGCQYRLYGAPNHDSILKKLRQAQNNLDAANNFQSKKIACEELIQLIRQIGSEPLPKAISVDGVVLNYKEWRYGITGYSSRMPAFDPNNQAAQNLMHRLNNAYKNECKKLMNTENQLKAEIQHINKTIEEKEVFDRLMVEMRKSYVQSIELAKEKIFLTINENAEKEGYSVKRNKFKKGKNAGREQYIIVKRS